jgi:hypothetical protein
MTDLSKLTVTDLVTQRDQHRAQAAAIDAEIDQRIAELKAATTATKRVRKVRADAGAKRGKE